tara:strand:- start:3523 stop:4245 length:723 start_codon:yes stop_codon:yes gene_type:complete
MQYDEFEKQITKVAIAFNRELSPELVMIYFEEFRGWTELQFKSAISKCIQECNFFPTVNDIRGRWRARQPSENVERQEVRLLESSAAIQVQPTLDEKINSMAVSEVSKLFQDYGLDKKTTADFCQRFEKREKIAINLIKDIVCPAWDIHKQKTVACKQCEDLGSIEVYAPETMALAQVGKLRPINIRTVMVSCDCRLRMYDPENPKHKPIVVFNADRMLRRSAVGIDEQILEVQEHGRAK